MKIKRELEIYIQKEVIIRNIYKRGASIISEDSPSSKLPEFLNLTGDIPEETSEATDSMSPISLRPRRQKNEKNRFQHILYVVYSTYTYDKEI